VGELSESNRPMTARELAIAFGVNLRRLESVMAMSGILPACHIAGIRLYGPQEIRNAYRALWQAGAITA
jgi:hypothetical protein